MSIYKQKKLMNLLNIDEPYARQRNFIKDEVEINLDAPEIEPLFTPIIERRERPKPKKVKELSIKPIISMEDSFQEPPNPILLSPPFSMLFIARPGSGKSTTTINLLTWYDNYFDQIFIISPTIGIDSSWVKARENGIINIPDENIMTSYNEESFKTIFTKIKNINKGVQNYSDKIKTLFIFDDIVAELPRKQKTFINNFARNHRHYGISHIILSQEMVAIPPVIRKNSYGICLYDSDNELERQAIIRAYGGKIGMKTFEKMWNECVKDKFGFLFFKPFENDLNKKFVKNFDKILNPVEFKDRKKDEKKKDELNKEIDKKIIKESDKEDMKEDVLEVIIDASEKVEIN